ncbi:MAG: hypothetical protein GYA16_09755, partial [Spirochaetes bacterium]|nr:hypothetical protein [Spirochaetota bacterium]
MIGDYEKVGWSTENPVPLTGYNLQKVDEKLDEIDKHLLSINTLSGVLQGPPGITVPNIHELEQLNEDLQQSDELIVYDTSSD